MQRIWCLALVTKGMGGFFLGCCDMLDVEGSPIYVLIRLNTYIAISCSASIVVML